MRKTDTQTISEIIKQLFKSPAIEKKYNQFKIIDSWKDILGSTISKSTTNIYIIDKTLFVYLKSSVIRNELYMIKEQLIKKLNEKVGKEVINEIIFK